MNHLSDISQSSLWLIVRHCMGYMFRAHGRASRKDYWRGLAIILGAWIVFFILVLSGDSRRNQDDGFSQPYEMMEFSSIEEEQSYLEERRETLDVHAYDQKSKKKRKGFVAFLVMVVASLWSLIALHIRRLHDTDQTGWVCAWHLHSLCRVGGGGVMVWIYGRHEGE